MSKEEIEQLAQEVHYEFQNQGFDRMNRIIKLI